MRIRVVFAAVLSLAAVPAFAQSPRDVTGPWTTAPAYVAFTDVPVTTRPVPRLVVAAGHRPDNMEGLTNGQLVIARSPDDGLAVGQKYVASRVTFERKLFSAPNEVVPLRVHGYVTVVAIDDINALAQID